MALVGIVLGILVGALVAAVVDGTLASKDCGAPIGFVVAIWAAWPFFHHHRVDRYNFLHPVPREYSLPVKQAFAKVRDLLAELSYHFGDKWQVGTADTQHPTIKRIVATLRFSDKETQTNMDARGGLHIREERKQRFLKLEAQLKDTGRDSTLVQLDFYPTVEGSNSSACDSIVFGFCEAVQLSMGFGKEAGSAADKRLPAPPVWLVGVSVLAVVLLLAGVGKRISGVMDDINSNPKKVETEKSARADQLKRVQDELDAWQKFKEANNLQ